MATRDQNVSHDTVLKATKLTTNSNCTGFPNTVVYHGHGRQGNPEALANSDIVLSTYHTIAAESLDETSPLWKINWYRIVLDEGWEENILDEFRD